MKGGYWCVLHLQVSCSAPHAPYIRGGDSCGVSTGGGGYTTGKSIFQSTCSAGVYANYCCNVLHPSTLHYCDSERGMDPASRVVRMLRMITACLPTEF